MTTLDILKKLYLSTEREIINELARLRSRGLIDYHAVAALDRIQKILTKMVGRSGGYMRGIIEKYFYANHPELYTKVPKLPHEHMAGYINAQALTATETDVIERLSSSVEYKLAEAAQNVTDGLTGVLLGRQAQDVFRQAGIDMVMRQQAQGSRLNVQQDFVEQLQRQGITCFTDKAGRKWDLHTYADMVSRTTARQAEVLSVITRDPGHDLYKMTSHYGACRLCAPYQGRVYSVSGTSPYYPPLSSAFGKIDPAGPDTLANSYLGIHPNCLVPGGTILAEGVMAHSSRDYDGTVIRLVTTGGDEISVTPNHPILTDKGFVAAGFLHKGDKVVKASGEYGHLIGEGPYNINIPTLVEDVPRSLMKAGKCSAGRVVTTAVDFHGDGIADGEVNIIFADGFVMDEADSLLGQPIVEAGFPAAHGRGLSFFTDRSFDEVAFGAFHSSDSIMSSSRFVDRVEGVSVDLEKLSDKAHGPSRSLGDLTEGQALIMKVQHSGKLFRVGFDVSGRNVVETSRGLRGEQAVVDKSAADGVDWHAEVLGNLRPGEALEKKRLERLFCDNGLIIDSLSHVESFHYCGKVYNLQTSCGFYAYNTIVTHNCLHSLMPWTEGGKSEEEIAEMRRFSNPATNPFDRDPRSQAEIDAYNKKEESRRKWLEAYKQWEKYRLAGIGPKTFNTFLKHKIADDEKYRAWLEAYRKRNE